MNSAPEQHRDVKTTTYGQKPDPCPWEKHIPVPNSFRQPTFKAPDDKPVTPLGSRMTF